MLFYAERYVDVKTRTRRKCEVSLGLASLSNDLHQYSMSIRSLAVQCLNIGFNRLICEPIRVRLATDLHVIRRGLLSLRPNPKLHTCLNI